MDVSFKINLILLVILAVLLIFGVLFVVRGVASRQSETRRRSSSSVGIFAALGIVFAVALVGLAVLYKVRSSSLQRSSELHRERALTEAADRAAQDRALRSVQRTEPSISSQGDPEPTVLITREASTTEIGSLPVLGLEQVFRHRGDFEAWNEGNALAPPEPAKPWTLNAAGSQKRTVDVLDWKIHGRWPGPEGKIVGYSAFDEPDSESALHTARHSAQHHLKAMLLGEVADFLKGPRAQGILRRAVGNFERRITDYVLKHEEDRLVQSREGSVGFPSFRAAVLVDADSETLEPFVQEFRDTIVLTQETDSAKRHELILALASALGLALVVFLLYSFLNAGTKGHFAWPLRIISIGTLVVLYLGLMFLQGWFPL